MKLACVSDLHGYLPDLSDIEFDILLIGGDICPVHDHSLVFQIRWLDKVFRQWLKKIERPVIAVSGNHDHVFEKSTPPKLPWTYLQDTGTEFQGLKIWGSPWQPTFHNWAFNLDEPELVEKWAMIPENTDILLLHGPPYGYGDFSPYDKIHTGSPGLTKVIERIKPKLVIGGHIHSARNLYFIGENTMMANVSIVNEQYKMTNKPFEFILDLDKKITKCLNRENNSPYWDKEVAWAN